MSIIIDGKEHGLTDEEWEAAFKRLEKKYATGELVHRPKGHVLFDDFMDWYLRHVQR